MDSVSEQARQRARELLNAATWREEEERVAAYVQRFSDAAKVVVGEALVSRPSAVTIRTALSGFILPDQPVDPLAEALGEVWPVVTGPSCDEIATALRANLLKRGFGVREIVK